MEGGVGFAVGMGFVWDSAISVPNYANGLIGFLEESEKDWRSRDVACNISTDILADSNNFKFC